MNSPENTGFPQVLLSTDTGKELKFLEIIFPGNNPSRMMG